MKPDKERTRTKACMAQDEIFSVLIDGNAALGTHLIQTAMQDKDIHIMDIAAAKGTGDIILNAIALGSQGDVYALALHENDQSCDMNPGALLYYFRQITEFLEQRNCRFGDISSIRIIHYFRAGPCHPGVQIYQLPCRTDEYELFAANDKAEFMFLGEKCVESEAVNQTCQSLFSASTKRMKDPVIKSWMDIFKSV